MDRDRGAVAAVALLVATARARRAAPRSRRSSGKVRDLEDRLPRAQRRTAGTRTWRCRARTAPAGAADPARDLAARPRRHRPREHEALGPAARRSAASRSISPDGQGRVLANYSWGSLGQIADLARMPQIVHLTLPWVHVDERRIYALGGSMGGQETLLLLARYPRLLAGAAAFDPVVELQAAVPRSSRTSSARRPAGRRGAARSAGRCRRSRAKSSAGSPSQNPEAFKLRSPITYARALAFSHVPLQIWWSPQDKIVIDQQKQAGRLVHLIRHLNPTRRPRRLHRRLAPLGRDALEDPAAAWRSRCSGSCRRATGTWAGCR